MKKRAFFLVISMIILAACSDGEQKSMQSNDPIIGVWKLHKYVDPISTSGFDRCKKKNTLTVYGDLSFDIVTYGANSKGECVEESHKTSQVYKLRKENIIYRIEDSKLTILNPSTLKIQVDGIRFYSIYKKAN